LLLGTVHGGVDSARNFQLDVFEEYWGKRIPSWQPAKLSWTEEVVISPMVGKSSPFHSQNEIQVCFVKVDDFQSAYFSFAWFIEDHEVAPAFKDGFPGDGVIDKGDLGV
jgi:hypothetical protein